MSAEISKMVLGSLQRKTIICDKINKEIDETIPEKKSVRNLKAF
jgi:hypothetical protein